ncbi:MAG: hypothetical protein PHV06_08175, partial [bacterium]|nr:hypothetical protein [bacterium]
MKKLLLTLTLSALILFTCFGAFEDIPLTGLSRGLGGALSPRIEGEESIFYNPAGLVREEKVSFSLSYCQPYQISDLNNSVIGIDYKLGRYNLGLGINQFSLTEVYTEQKIIAGIGTNFKRLFLGAAVNYYSISISGLYYMPSESDIPPLKSKSSATTITIGSILRATENLNLSLTIYDIGGAEFTHSSDTEGNVTELPMQVSAGGFYNFRDYVFISAELKNSLDDFGFLDKSLRLGIEYVFYKTFSFRLGNYSGNTTYGFGI